MLRYIIRKIVYGCLVLFGVITVVFFLFHSKPGDPARLLGGQNVNEEIIKSIRKDLGLDLPLYKQYLLYLNDLSPLSINSTNANSHLYLDSAKYTSLAAVPIGPEKLLVIKKPYLRRSYQTKQRVSEIIWDTLPETILLAFVSILIATLLGVFLGIMAALRKGSFFDSFSMVVAVLGMSGPSFFLGVIIVWIGAELWYKITYLPQLPFYFLGLGLIFGVAYNQYRQNRINKRFSIGFLIESGLKGFGLGMLFWLIGIAMNGMLGYDLLPLINNYFELPGTNLSIGPLTDFDDFTGEVYYRPSKIILPALTLGIRPLAIVLQLTRSSMLDVLSQDYIRTAKAKGLSSYKVIYKHALKNSLSPVITAISGWFASLLAGAVFVENIFSWNGIGKKVFDSVTNDDLPVVVGSVLVIATMFVIINILVDIIYGFLDPRIRLS